jgi:outer membrane protein, heavy metal efflux system
MPQTHLLSISTIGSSSRSQAFGLLFLAGCATARTPELPSELPAWAVPLPPQGQVEVALPVVSVPDPEIPSSVSLEQLLVYADSNAPALGIARAESGRGEAGVLAASVLLQNNPELGIGFGSLMSDSESFTEAEVAIAQRIGAPGERSLRLETAKLAQEVSLGTLEEERWAIHVATHALFYEGLIAHSRVAAAEQAVQFALELDQVAANRIESGEDSPITRLVAQSELALARERLIQMRQGESSILLLLAETVGWPTDRLLSISGSLPPVRPTKEAEALVRIAAEHHPSFRVLSLAVAHAESNVRLQEREAWPDPTFGLAYGREDEISTSEDIWRVSVGVPLVFWNRDQGDRANARVALDVASAERDSLHRRWRGQLERSAQRVNAAAERVEIYGVQALPAVERNLLLIRRAYELGELDIHAVSQTRSRLFTIQAQAIDALSAYFRSLAELEGLVGTDVSLALQDVLQ